MSAFFAFVYVMLIYKFLDYYYLWILSYDSCVQHNNKNEKLLHQLLMIKIDATKLFYFNVFCQMNQCADYVNEMLGVWLKRSKYWKIDSLYSSDEILKIF